MEEVHQSKMAAVFLAVVSYENPQSLVSPETFRDIILTTLQNGSSFQTHNISSNMDVSTCSDCMLLYSLSALDALLQYVEETNHCTLKSPDTSDYANRILKYPIAIPSQHKGRSELKKNNSIWYMDASKQFSSSNIAELLVEYLVCGNKNTSFLARRTLLSGMRNQHIETLHVLTLLKQKWDADCHFCVPLIEIFRDMMSQRKSIDGQINCKTFNLLKEINLKNVAETQFRENKVNYLDTSGLLEYISLLHKVIKYGIQSYKQSTSQDIFFITEIVKNILLPLLDYFLTTAKSDDLYLICLESIKAINSFLNVRFLEEKLTFVDCILQICVNLQTKVVSYLQMARRSNLLSGFNFVGTILSSQDSVNISALTRQLILLAMKTFCLTMKGDCSCSIVISNLECLWNEVCCIMSCMKDQLTKDWLPVVFADQDDQWIITLFCLLIIHKELKKWRSNDQNLLCMDTNVATIEECSLKNLQQVICPHKLFLQLASFIDHDHLVLVDFLTSPETPFLSYFTKYLHVMSEDWHSFVLSCLNDDTNINKNRNSENSLLDKHAEHQKGSFEAKKSVMTLPEFSTAESLPQCFVKISHEVPHSNIPPSLQTSKESSPTIHNKHVQNAEPVDCSDEYSAKVLKESLQSSIVPFRDTHLVSLSNDYLQTSSIVSYDLSLNSVPTSRTIINSTALPNDCFYNLSVLPGDVLQNSSSMQSRNKQEQSISQSFVYDKVADLCGSNSHDRSQALVAYSDSDSEDCMEEMKTNVTAKKINVKRISLSNSDSDDPCTEDGVQIHKSLYTLPVSSNSDAHSAFYHESTLVNITDKNVNCNNEVDNVLGMFIRLRLHIERLDQSKLFPYNPKPLLLLLEACEELYETPSGL